MHARLRLAATQTVGAPHISLSRPESLPAARKSKRSSKAGQKASRSAVHAPNTPEISNPSEGIKLCQHNKRKPYIARFAAWVEAAGHSTVHPFRVPRSEAL